MHTRTTRLLTAGAAVAALAAVATAAAAAESQPKPPPTPAASASPTGKAPGAASLDALAARLRISSQTLSAGLEAAKRAGGAGQGGTTAFAQTTGVSMQGAQQAVTEVFGAGSDRGLTGSVAVAGLAAQLGVSPARAREVVDRLMVLGRQRGGIDPNGSAFVALARDLHLSPQQLAGAVDTVKRASASP